MSIATALSHMSSHKRIEISVCDAKKTAIAYLVRLVVNIKADEIIGCISYVCEVILPVKVFAKMKGSSMKACGSKDYFFGTLIFLLFQGDSF